MRIKPFWRRPDAFFEERCRLYREFLKTPFAEHSEMTSAEQRGVDGIEEFVVHMATVGPLAERPETNC